MKKRFSAALALALAAILLAMPAFAAADSCTMTMTDTMPHTLASLIDCVNQAIAMGHITSPAVAQSLLAQLTSAQAALGRGQTAAAIGSLQAFVATVRAQAGLHINPQCAQHMVMHAQMVIAGLRG